MLTCVLKAGAIVGQWEQVITLSTESPMSNLAHTPKWTHLPVILLAAIALASCGTIATAVAPAPLCPAHGHTAPATSFCTTPAESAAGMTPVHIPGVPDIIILSTGASYTSVPSGTPIAISQSQAIQAALKLANVNYPGTTAISATLVQIHDACGFPTTGHPAWIVNLRPPVGARTMSESPPAIQYMLVGVDPATGVPWGLGTFRVHRRLERAV